MLVRTARESKSEIGGNMIGSVIRRGGSLGSAPTGALSLVSPAEIEDAGDAGERRSAPAEEPGFGDWEYDASSDTSAEASPAMKLCAQSGGQPPPEAAAEVLRIIPEIAPMRNDAQTASMCEDPCPSEPSGGHAPRRGRKRVGRVPVKILRSKLRALRAERCSTFSFCSPEVDDLFTFRNGRNCFVDRKFRRKKKREAHALSEVLFSANPFFNNSIFPSL